MAIVSKAQSYHSYKLALAAIGGPSARVVKMRLKQYAGGHGELSFRQIQAPHTRVWMRDPDKERQRSTARARANIADRLLAMRADRIATLTYRRNETDLPVSREHLRKFIAGMRARYPKWKCVAVAERQKRGAVHWHMGVRGFQDIPFMRQLWCHIIGEAGAGQVNVGRRVRDPRRLSYIAKYVGKDMDADERPRYGHHYVVSRGLEFQTTEWMCDDMMTLAEALRQGQLLLDEMGVKRVRSHATEYRRPEYRGSGWVRW